MLLRAMLLQAFFSIRSERQLMERLEFDLLFRWFVGLSADELAWDASTDVCHASYHVYRSRVPGMRPELPPGSWPTDPPYTPAGRAAQDAYEADPLNDPVVNCFRQAVGHGAGLIRTAVALRFRRDLHDLGDFCFPLRPAARQS